MRHLSFLAIAATLPVLAQVGNLQLSTNALNFSAVAGSTLPQQQVFGVTSTGATLPVTLSVVYFGPNEGWLTVSTDNASTPANVTVTANSAGLAAGSYTANVSVVASGSQSGYVTVTLNVSSSGPSGGLITANPATVSLASTTGQLIQTTVALSISGFVPFQVFVSTTSGGNWLSFIAANTTSPTSITISANPAGLVAGTYSGTVSVAPSTGAPGVAIPVTLTVSGGGGVGGFSLNPSSMNFVHQIGNANPAVQATFVSNFDGIVSYVATSSASWLRLTSNNVAIPAQQVNGTSNANLVAHVDAAGLSAGFYTATVTVNASNAQSRTLAVSLTVSGNSLLGASPSSLVFSYSPDTGVPAAQQTVISASGTPLGFTVSANSTGWLLAGPQTGATNGANVVTVSVSPVGLPAGTYTGAVNIASGLSAIHIPVTLIVGASNVNNISASPQTLAFQAPLGSTATTQNVFLNAAAPKNFLASVSASGGNWLQVSPNNGTTPASLAVNVNPQAVGAAGVYNGVVQISNLTDGTQLVIPVSLTVNAANLSASPQSLSFSLAAGAAAGASQIVQLSGTANTVFSATSNSAWLGASPSTGPVPGAVTISVSAAALSSGTYSGAVTVTSGNASVNIPVTLNVTSSSAPILTPSNLTFQFTPGNAPPAAQAIAVNSTAGAVSFSYSPLTGAGGDWLGVTADASTTPATLTVQVRPAGLAAGTYRGTITVSTQGGAEVRSAEVTLTVTAPAGPVLRTGLHGATRELSAITPGMILSLMGSAIGVSSGTLGTVTPAGAYETALNGYRALFDGVPAPILYSSRDRMDVVVPYSTAGRAATSIVIENAGGRSDPLELRLSPDAAPGIFSLDGSGRGQAAALNQNGTVNGAGNRAGADEVLVFFATGEGQTRPAGQDGRIIATDLRVPQLPVAVNLGGVPVEVLYAGSAPGQVSGLMQINVRLNGDVPRGPAVPLELRVGPAPSQPGLTVAIQ